METQGAVAPRYLVKTTGDLAPFQWGRSRKGVFSMGRAANAASDCKGWKASLREPLPEVRSRRRAYLTAGAGL